MLLLLLATLTAVVGVAVAAVIAPDAWAVDARRNLGAASDLLAGRFGADHGYVYSPLAAALTVPWTLVPTDAAVWLWFLARSVVLVGLVAAGTTAWRPTDRLLALVVAAFFVPTVYDLIVGNVTILIAAAIALVAWRRDATWTGVAVGLALATVPKPQLLPVLLWMLAYRPRALLGAGVTAAVATAAGALALGPATYAAWIGVLRSVDYLSTPMHGNLSLFAFLPAGVAAAATIAAVAATLLALRRGPWAGLVACLTLGLLVAPYTLAYAPAVLVVVAPRLADRAPRFATSLGLTATPGVILALPAWLAAALAGTLLLPLDEPANGPTP